MCSLTAFVLALTVISVSGISFYEEVPIRFWKNLFPWLNETFVEHCYYDAVYDRREFWFCNAIAHPGTAEFLDKLMEPLHEMLLDYQANEPHDQQRLVDCVISQSNSQANSSVCLSPIFHRTTSTHRYVKASLYLDELYRYQVSVNRCIELEDSMAPITEECDFLEQIELVEHCFTYHQFTRYPPCKDISWPKIALPFDVPSMYRYQVWHTASYDFEEQLEEYRMGMEGIPDPMAVVMFCLRNSTWLHDPNSECQNVTEPVKGLVYPKLMSDNQKRYNQKRRDELRKDCLTYHQDEHFLPCKYITWR